AASAGYRNAEPPVRLFSVKRGRMPRYSAAESPDSASSPVQTNSASTSDSLRFASANASSPALPARSSGLNPGASPMPKVALPTMAERPRGNVSMPLMTAISRFSAQPNARPEPPITDNISFLCHSNATCCLGQEVRPPPAPTPPAEAAAASRSTRRRHEPQRIPESALATNRQGPDRHDQPPRQDERHQSGDGAIAGTTVL